MRQDERKEDLVDSILSDKRKYELCIETETPQSTSKSLSLVSRIVNDLLQEDRVRLLSILKNLNTKHEYTSIAQHLLTYILPKFKPDEYIEEFKKADDKAAGAG